MCVYIWATREMLIGGLGSPGFVLMVIYGERVRVDMGLLSGK